MRHQISECISAVSSASGLPRKEVHALRDRLSGIRAQFLFAPQYMERSISEGRQQARNAICRQVIGMHLNGKARDLRYPLTLGLQHRQLGSLDVDLDGVGRAIEE